VQELVPLQRQTPHTKTVSKLSAERESIDRFWNSLDAAEQQRIEQELVLKAPPFVREQYLEGQQERGLLFQAVRQAMIDEYVRKEGKAP
jgi:hypothetical protein